MVKNSIMKMAPEFQEFTALRRKKYMFSSECVYGGIMSRTNPQEGGRGTGGADCIFAVLPTKTREMCTINSSAHLLWDCSVA